MSSRNRIPIDDAKLSALLRAEINQGAKFVNILNGPVSLKECLVVTSLATHYVQGGLFKVKIKWSIPHKALDDVYYERGSFQGRVTDKLIFLTGGERRQFVFGMSESGPASKAKRDAAENNAKVAEDEIRTAKAYLQHVEQNAAAPDPEVDRFERAMALVQAGPIPDTEPSDHWTNEDYIRVVGWMFDAWEEKKYSAIWARRIALGSGLEQRSASQLEWFWVNALPALSGLQLGQKEHPSLAVYAGYSEQALDPMNEKQQSALTQIKEQFFG
ncbi:MAG: hypothetical protein ACLPYW_13645 [Acidimicrobiales bacterium]